MSKTNAILKVKSGTRIRGSRLACLGLLLSLLCLVSCRPTREEIKAHLWLNNTPLPAEICIQIPELQYYGFYRRLNDGSLEFISFCEEEARQWISIHEIDFDELLDKYVPAGKKK